MVYYVVERRIAESGVVSSDIVGFCANVSDAKIKLCKTLIRDDIFLAKKKYNQQLYNSCEYVEDDSDGLVKRGHIYYIKYNDDSLIDWDSFSEVSGVLVGESYYYLLIKRYDLVIDYIKAITSFVKKVITESAKNLGIDVELKLSYGEAGKYYIKLLKVHINFIKNGNHYTPTEEEYYSLSELINGCYIEYGLLSEGARFYEHCVTIANLLANIRKSCKPCEEGNDVVYYLDFYDDSFGEMVPEDLRNVIHCAFEKGYLDYKDFLIGM